MKSSSLVSIIVPLYNREASIAKCLSSIAAQTYTEWECVVVDDGSTDGSADVVKRFLSDARFKYCYKKNGGVSSARNYGVRNSTGEYVVFMDADDYFIDIALQEFVSLVTTYGTKVAAANYYFEYGGQRTLFSRRGSRRLVSRPFRNWVTADLSLRAGAAIFDREVVLDNPYDETLSRYEDAKSVFEIMRKNIIAFSPTPVMVYSKDTPGLSRDCSQLERDYTFYLDFKGKSFDEKLALGKLLLYGFRSYPTCRILFLRKYSFWCLYALFSGTMLLATKMRRLINGCA